MARRKRTRRRYYQRRKKSRKKGSNLQQQVFKIVRIGSLVAPGAGVVLERGLSAEAAKGIVSIYTGYDMDSGQFDFEALKRGWAPFVITSLVTYAIPKLTGFVRKIF